MHRASIVVGLLLLAAPAFAQDAKAVGFTQDGKLFVVAVADAIGSDDVGSYALWDPRSGSQVGDPIALAAFPAWKASHPLAPLAAGRASPDKKLTLDEPAGGEWKDGRWVGLEGVNTWAGPHTRVPRPSNVTFSVREGAAARPSASFRFEHMNVRQEVEPIWSPDGKRIAFLVHDVGIGEGPSADYEVAFGPTRTPRVQVLAQKGLAPERLDAIADALDRAGLPPTGSGDANDPHPQTTVFAAKGFEKAASAASAALPASKIEPLTWKPGYELVVVPAAK